VDDPWVCGLTSERRCEPLACRFACVPGGFARAAALARASKVGSTICAGLGMIDVSRSIIEPGAIFVEDMLVEVKE